MKYDFTHTILMCLVQIRFTCKLVTVRFYKINYDICRKIQQFMHATKTLNLWTDFQSTTEFHSRYFSGCFWTIYKVDTNNFLDNAKESTKKRAFRWFLLLTKCVFPMQCNAKQSKSVCVTLTCWKSFSVLPRKMR